MIEKDPKVYSLKKEHNKSNVRKSTKIKPKCWVGNGKYCKWITRQGKFYDKNPPKQDDIYRANIAFSKDKKAINELYRVRKNGHGSINRDEGATAHVTTEPQSPQLIR